MKIVEADRSFKVDNITDFNKNFNGHDDGNSTFDYMAEVTMTLLRNKCKDIIVSLDKGIIDFTVGYFDVTFTFSFNEDKIYVSQIMQNKSFRIFPDGDGKEVISILNPLILLDRAIKQVEG